ncbi:unnamed protein product [Aureobasidium uvarum]|uniref:Mtf2-like C-terminal domain-containing protein n=1 Tax=Aureobasidium uvarum TaxID=2773716 RepID=A0A9N8KDW4_9PEZI|nr:unnamed protein product [Aureobasidium uvarum]
MSGCANAGQALSRGLKLYTSKSAYTLPFLYQTPTLRRYYSALQDLANENAPTPVRNIRLRKSKIPREPTPTTAPSPKTPEYEDFVPFETSRATESAVVQQTVQGESLTGTERNAFAQLEALANAPKRPVARKRESVLSLDDVLNEAISAIEVMEHEQIQRREQNPTSTKKRSRGGSQAANATAARRTPGKSENDSLGLTTAPDTAVSRPKEQKKTDWIPITREDKRALFALRHSDVTDPMHWSVKRVANKKEPAPEPAPQGSNTSIFRELAENNKRLLTAIHVASTDTELWEILETNFFREIGLLHLDSPAPTSATISSERRSFLMQVFPFHLIKAASVLRTFFPTSNLILAILPRIKQLGPSAYALAATADLYNQLFAFHFRKFSDVGTCNELLQEMEDNIIEPAPPPYKSWITSSTTATNASTMRSWDKR